VFKDIFIDSSRVASVRRSSYEDEEVTAAIAKVIGLWKALSAS